MKEYQHEFLNCTGYNKKPNNIKRTLFLDIEYKNQIAGAKYKFHEDIVWSDDYKIDVVCVGYNPALAEENIDHSNKRIIKALNSDDCILGKKYGYYLYNLFPEIAATAPQVNQDSPTNKSFFKNSIVSFINSNKELKVIVFFGRSIQIPSEVIVFLNTLVKEDRLYMTVHNSKFTHPGSNGDVKIMKVSSVGTLDVVCAILT